MWGVKVVMQAALSVASVVPPMLESKTRKTLLLLQITSDLELAGAKM